MRKLIVGALIFMLLFSIAAPGFSVSAAGSFDAKTPITIDGVAYSNVALDKSYERTGDVYDGKWTDTGTDGKPLGKMTDGVVAEAGNDEAVGCYKSNETSVTIDLGKAYAIKQVTTDLYGFADWGIPDPDLATITVFVSSDGSSFTKVGDAQKSEEKGEGGWKLRLFTLSLGETVSARYVRVTYKINGTFCWTSEVAVFGVESSSESSELTESSAPSSEAPSSSASAEPASSSSSSASSAASSAGTSSASNPETGEDDLIYAFAIVGVAALVSIMIVVRNRRKEC